MSIQLAWRRFTRRKKQGRIPVKKAVKPTFSSTGATALKVGDDMWKREIAALTIQLAWRQVRTLPCSC